MADDPDTQRSWFHVEKLGNLSVKKTFFKFAPSLRLGFGSIFGRTVLAAAALAAPVAIVAESAGAIDVIDTDPQVVNLTVLATDEEAVTIFTEPPSRAADGTVFDKILDAIAGIETDVTVTVAPIDAQTRQTLIQIGSLLEFHSQQNRDILAAIEGIEFDPPPVNPPGLTQSQADEIIEQLDEVLDSQDVIEDAIFPGRGECPDCPESVTE